MHALSGRDLIHPRWSEGQIENYWKITASPISRMQGMSAGNVKHGDTTPITNEWKTRVTERVGKTCGMEKTYEL